MRRIHEKRRKLRPFVRYKRRRQVDGGIVALVILLIALMAGVALLIWLYIRGELKGGFFY